MFKNRNLWAAKAISLQDGCNPVGIACTLWEYGCEASKNGSDTAAICNDPVFKLILFKIMDLCHISEEDGTGSQAFGQFSEAYTECKLIEAGKKE